MEVAEIHVDHDFHDVLPVTVVERTDPALAQDTTAECVP
jgi:hypothetical protein